MTSSYIGSRISITTGSKVRFEGVLTEINVNDSTVTLTQGTLKLDWSLAKTDAGENAHFLLKSTLFHPLTHSP